MAVAYNARGLSISPGLGRRADDALHVAVAAEPGATLCTLDKRLADAAVALGANSEMV
jgi:uncharacterized protein